MKRTSSRGLVAGAVLGATAIALAGYAATQASPLPADGGASNGTFTGTLSALTRPATAEDALPPELLKLPIAESLSTGGTRRLGDLRGRTFWAVPGLNGELCFLASSGSGDTFESAGTCADPAQLKQGGIWFSEVSGERTQSVSILLSDGVQTVGEPSGRLVDATNNIAVVDVVASNDSSITLTDTAGGSHSLNLGDLTPPK